MDQAETPEAVESAEAAPAEATPEVAVAETAKVVTEEVSKETAAQATETKETSEEPAEETPAEVSTAPVVLPPEIQAQIETLTEEQKAWGPQWDIRDLARNSTNALLRGTTDEALGALAEISGPKTYQLVQDVLEAQAAEHVAREHGISPQELKRRLGTAPAEVQIPRSLERALETLDESDQKAVRDLIAERDEVKRRLTDSVRVAKQAENQAAQTLERTASNQFANEFAGWQRDIITDLADVTPGQLNAVGIVTREAFATDRRAEAAIKEYYAAVMGGENEKILKTTFLPPVIDVIKAITAEQLKALKIPLKAAPPKPPTNGAKPAGTAAKVINPTKAADAAKAATAKATTEEKQIPTTNEWVAAEMQRVAARNAELEKQKGASR